MTERTIAAERWQPIETAPKDGTGILVICMGAEKPQAGQAWFMFGIWTAIDPADKELLGGEEFFRAMRWDSPTHWMPLPPPPTPEPETMK